MAVAVMNVATVCQIGADVIATAIGVGGDDVVPWGLSNIAGEEPDVLWTRGCLDIGPVAVPDVVHFDLPEHERSTLIRQLNNRNG